MRILVEGYICERHLVTDYQIEHLKSQHHYPDLKQNRNNILLSCGYCNGKKLHNYDDIIDPVRNNVEEQIKQEINFSSKKAIFTSDSTSAQIPPTIELLSKVFNGNNKDIHGMNIYAGTSFTDPGFFKRIVVEKRIFEKKHYLFPILQIEINKNPALIQNSFWEK